MTKVYNCINKIGWISSCLSVVLILATAVMMWMACAGVGAAADEVEVTFERHFGGVTYAAAVSGNYAFINQGQDFVVLDISDPAIPLELSRLVTDSMIRDITVSGDYAYVACGFNGLVIVDISNKNAPVFAGSYDTVGYAFDVSVSGDYAYIAGGSNGLVIVDISNKNAPVFAGSYDAAGDELYVSVSGDYAYIAGGSNGLVIVDISNKNAPVFAGSYDTAGCADGVSVSGDYAYVADWEESLVIVDISNKNAPVFAGSYDTAGYALGVSVSGDYAYVADSTNGLVIVDISNKNAPVFAGSYDTGWAHGVSVSGDYAYVADTYNGLLIVDISNKNAPVFAGSYDTAGHAVCVSVSGDYVYVADCINGLVILRMSTANDTTPIEQNEIEFTGTAIEYQYLIGAAWWNVSIENLISGPQPCNNNITVSLYTYPPMGYADPNIIEGDKVEVYGKYIEGQDRCNVTLNGREEYYIKKVTGPKIIEVDDDFVDDPTNHKWDTIQEGVNDANDGDTVLVHSGTYYGNVVVNNSGITLKGIDNPVVEAGGFSVASDGDVIENVIIEGFNLTSGQGIWCFAVNDSRFMNNTITQSGWLSAMLFEWSYNNTIMGNKISDNDCGIQLFARCSNNTIMGNNISNNSIGINLIEFAGNNTIYHNNFVKNTVQVRDDVDPAQWGANRWNNSYPSGGNYWSDYDKESEGAIDEKSGPNQDDDGSDGIVDMPYYISGSAGVKDKYPLVHPCGEEPLPDLTIQNVTIEPENFNVGDRVNISVQISNIGDMPAEKFIVELWRELPIELTSVEKLDSYSMTTIVFAYTIRSTNESLSVIINRFYEVVEKNYSNNGVDFSLKIPWNLWKTVNIEDSEYRIYVAGMDLDISTSAQSIARSGYSKLMVLDEHDNLVKNTNAISEILFDLSGCSFGYMEPDDYYAFKIHDFHDTMDLVSCLDIISKSVEMLFPDSDQEEIMSDVILGAVSHDKPHVDKEKQMLSGIVTISLASAGAWNDAHALHKKVYHQNIYEEYCSISNENQWMDDLDCYEHEWISDFADSLKEDITKAGYFFAIEESNVNPKHTAHYDAIREVTKLNELYILKSVLKNYDGVYGESNEFLLDSTKKAIEKQQKITKISLVLDDTDKETEAFKIIANDIANTITKANPGQMVSELALRSTIKSLFKYAAIKDPSYIMLSKLFANYQIGVSLGFAITNLNEMLQHAKISLLASSATLGAMDEAEFIYDYQNKNFDNKHLGSYSRILGAVKDSFTGYAYYKGAMVEESAFWGIYDLITGGSKEFKERGDRRYSDSEFKEGAVLTYSGLVVKCINLDIDNKLKTAMPEPPELSIDQKNREQLIANHYDLGAEKAIILRDSNFPTDLHSEYYLEGGYWLDKSIDGYTKSAESTIDTDLWLFSSSDTGRKNGIFNCPKAFIPTVSNPLIKYTYHYWILWPIMQGSQTVEWDIEFEEYEIAQKTPVIELLPISQKQDEQLLNIDQLDLDGDLSPDSLNITWHLSEPKDGLMLISVTGYNYSKSFAWGLEQLSQGSASFSSPGCDNYTVQACVTNMSIQPLDYQVVEGIVLHKYNNYIKNGTCCISYDIKDKDENGCTDTINITVDTKSNFNTILLAYQNETLFSALNYTNKYFYEFTENPGSYTLRLIVYDQPSNEIIYSGEQKFLLGQLIKKSFYNISDKPFNNQLKVDLTVKVQDSETVGKVVK